MRAFGIIMALFGCGIAFFGFVLISETEDVSRITCSASGTPSSPQTVCYFDTDPNEGIRQSSGGLAVTVVGAGFIAGGLACAAGGGRGGSQQRTSYAPPVGGGQAYSGAAGSPPAYGQQTQQPPSSSSGPQPWGTPQQ